MQELLHKAKKSNPIPIQIRPILESAGELTTEVLRLITLYPHDEDTFRALGVAKEDFAASLVADLPEPGAAWLCADDGRRLQGMIYLQPDLWPSAVLNHRVWTIQHLVLAEDAQAETAHRLVVGALEALGDVAEFIQISHPEADALGIEALRQAGFRRMGTELVTVARTEGVQADEIPQISVEAAQAEHLETISGMTGNCRRCNPFVSDWGFEPEKVAHLARRMHHDCMRESGCRSLVALEQSRDEVLGTLGYRRDPRLQTTKQAPLAELDHFCLRSGAPSGLARFLNARMMAELGRDSVEAVTARFLLNDDCEQADLSWLDSMGYRITARHALLHKWLKIPPASTPSVPPA